MKVIVKILSGVLLLMSTVLFGENMSNMEKFPEHIKNVTALTEVFGTGQKLTGVIIEFDKSVINSELAKDTFSVTDRTVTKIYANNKGEKAQQGKNGKYIIIELSEKDEKAQLFIKADNILPAKILLTQNKDIKTSGGNIYKKNKSVFTNNKVKNLVVEDFKQLEYKDPKTGITLKYNLYIPKNYNKNKKYPLVLFMHDAGPLSEKTETTLLQGNGATIWATPEEQAKHEAFVLAPQYPVKVVDDNGNATEHLEATVNLLKDYIVKQYKVDTEKMYVTGQSMGGMMGIVMNFRYPELFAASYFVACQWDASLTPPMAKNKMWTVVSTGDVKAFPGWNAITDVLAENGGVVIKDTWRGDYTSEQFNQGVKKVLSENPHANIKYTVIEKGTLPDLKEGNPGSEHMATWKTAYNIEGIRNWLFQQKK
ncbi:MAG: alpha/beta hydrolase-fold protein [Leptotrichiaceae bacterium]|nr:alpha/beta hydrolase-fold protein [Leptotrichiaceae bacterium]